MEVKNRFLGKKSFFIWEYFLFLHFSTSVEQMDQWWLDLAYLLLAAMLTTPSQASHLPLLFQYFWSGTYDSFLLNFMVTNYLLFCRKIHCNKLHEEFIVRFNLDVKRIYLTAGQSKIVHDVKYIHVYLYHINVMLCFVCNGLSVIIITFYYTHKLCLFVASDA